MKTARIPVGGLKPQKSTPGHSRRFIPKNLKVGDVIRFGRCNQSNRAFVELIDWRVLSMDNEFALVISEKIIEKGAFDTSKKHTNEWEKCTLRQYLNGKFLTETFNADEEDLICLTYLKDGKNEFADRIFLLSDEEAAQFFESDADRQCEPTHSVIAKGIDGCLPKDSFWYLRTASTLDGVVHGVDGGTLEGITSVSDDTKGIRPALVLDIYDAINA